MSVVDVWIYVQMVWPILGPIMVAFFGARGIKRVVLKYLYLLNTNRTAQSANWPYPMMFFKRDKWAALLALLHMEDETAVNPKHYSYRGEIDVRRWKHVDRPPES